MRDFRNTLLALFILVGTLFLVAADDLRHPRKSQYANSVEIQGATPKFWFSPTSTDTTQTVSNFFVQMIEIDWTEGAAECSVAVWTSSAPGTAIAETLTVPAGATYTIEGHPIGGVQVIDGPTATTRLYLRVEN